MTTPAPQPDDMSAAMGVFDWLVKWGFAVVAGGFGALAGAIAAAWRAGVRYAELRTDISKMREDLEELRATVAALQEKRNELMTAIACKPDRQEVITLIESLREDVRVIASAIGAR